MPAVLDAMSAGSRSGERARPFPERIGGTFRLEPACEVALNRLDGPFSLPEWLIQAAS
jgi:hypothetical protein